MTSTTIEAETISVVTTDKLLLTGAGYQLIVPPAAESKKAELIAAAAAITVVTSPEEAAIARDEIIRLAKFRNEIEKARGLVKAPVLDLGKEIDAKAKDFGADTMSHENRLKKLVENHAAEVERQRRAAEVERQRIEREAERQRQEAERQRQAEEAARIKAEQEAEAARIAAEKAAAAAAEGQDDEEDIEAQIAAAKAIDEANAARAKAEAEAKAAREAEAARAAEAARLAEERRRADLVSRQGTSGVKFATDFYVEDVHALYAYSSALVELTPKRRDILALISQLEAQGGGVLPTIPGLKITRKPVVGTR